MTDYIGVKGVSLPSTGQTGIQPAEFRKIGVQMRASRQFADIVTITAADQIPFVLGPHVQAYNGRYCLENAFLNLNGTPGEFRAQLIQPSDAVQAFDTLQDTQVAPEDTLTIKAAWRDIDDKSADGNNTGYTLLNGYRTSTTARAAAIATATEIYVAGASEFRANDLIYIDSAAPEYAKILSIDQAQRKLTLTAGLAGAVAIDDPIHARGFRITSYRRNQLTGVEEPQNLIQDALWLSMESIGDDLYVGTAYSFHPWARLVDEQSTGTLNARWPADVTNITYLSSGAQGTTPDETAWANALSDFNNQPVRWICNTEVDTADYNRTALQYCQGRADKPLWFGSAPQYATVAEYQTYGQQLLIAQDVYGALFGGRRPVVDPVGQGANPKKLIPRALSKAAQHCQSIQFTGFHSAPAGVRYPLIGFLPQSTTENRNDLFSGEDLAAVAGAGINLALQRDGLLIDFTGRSFSTLKTAKFYSWKLMENFLKFSIADSLRRPFVGAPLRLSDLERYADQVRDYARLLETQGSWPPGTDQKGPWGHYRKEDGSMSSLEDVFEVSTVGNTQAEIDDGNAFLTIRFRPPGLGEKLEIRVGVTLAQP